MFVLWVIFLSIAGILFAIASAAPDNAEAFLAASGVFTFIGIIFMFIDVLTI